MTTDSRLTVTAMAGPATGRLVLCNSAGPGGSGGGGGGGGLAGRRGPARAP